MRRPPLVPTPRRRRWLPALTAAALCLLGVLSALVGYIHGFGLADHRRPADAILVLGARAYADGRASEALSERVATGVQLYRQGLAPRLLMSGGIGEGGVSEPRVMRRLAVEAGVPEGAIDLDEQGNNTEASLRYTHDYLRDRGLSTVLVVSHYHHLARVKLLGDRHGVTCFTVPADEGETLLAKTPYYVLREAAALAFYFLRG